MPAKTEESAQVNLWIRHRFLAMLDKLVEQEEDVCPTSRAKVVMALIGKEFRRRKLELDNT